MGVIIAIIGQSSVGKSLLKNQLVKQGVIEIDIVSMLSGLLGAGLQAKTWRQCLNGELHKLSGHVRTLSSPEVRAVIQNCITIAKSSSLTYVVEIPCFISVHLYADCAIDGVVFVDCSYEDQTQYLKMAGATDTAVHYLRTHIQGKDLYRSVATDIFHNSVSLSHIEWVAEKIHQSYSLQLTELSE
jgi:dephospho-CoA kinase